MVRLQSKWLKRAKKLIRKDLFETMNNAGIVNKALVESDNCFAFINVDVLNGCYQSCAGCFVNKGINSRDLDNDLDQVLKVTNEINASGVHLEEIVIGPTDLFSAKNTDDLIANDKFYEILKHPKTVLSFISTLRASYERIEHIIKELEARLPNLDIDLIVAIDADEIYDNQEKIDEIKRKFEIFERSSMRFEPAFQINIHPANLFKHDMSKLSELSRLIRKEFNTILEFNPSLLRVKHRAQHDKLDHWTKMVRENFENEEGMIYTQANNNHRGVTNLVYNFTKGKFYLCPFVYENVFIYTPTYEIKPGENGYDFQLLQDAFQNALVQQFEYANTKADKCSSCTRLTSCVYKNVLTFMEDNDITHCFIDMYTEDQDGS